MDLKYVYLKVMENNVDETNFGTCILEAMTVIKTVNLSEQGKKTDCGESYIIKR